MTAAPRPERAPKAERGPLPDASPLGSSRAYEAARLRWASLADAPRLAALWAEARPERPEAQGAMRAWLEHGGALLLEDAAGELLCALRWREDREGGGWRVDRIATLPSVRGQGYGRWLMTKVEALAIRKNIGLLTLALDARELVPYYERMGWRHEDDEIGGDGSGDALLRKRVGGVWQTKAGANLGPAGSGGTA